MRTRRSVALVIETSNAYARGLVHGVMAYLREHRRWSISLGEQGRGESPPVGLRGWRGDGIIARIENRAVARAVRRAGLPTVDVSAARLVPGLPWVETDDGAIAGAAARHLLERGFTRFGYCGDERFNWSRWRGEAFAAAIREAGFEVSAYRPRVPEGKATWAQQQAGIARWVRGLGGLSGPVGIMACYDVRGRQVLEACRSLGAHVPDEVAVIGVDNDELVCELADPPLSSVIPDAHRTGYAAAALLDRMMAGETAGAGATRIEPLGIRTRQSTDVLAIEDRLISQAVRFIREHACDGVSVKDLLRSVPLSRRVLEARFRKLMGSTPHEQIVRTQVERVKELLTQTDLPLVRVAERSGFRHVEYMSVVFRKQVGMPPGAYRSRSPR